APLALPAAPALPRLKNSSVGSWRPHCTSATPSSGPGFTDRRGAPAGYRALPCRNHAAPFVVCMSTTLLPQEIPMAYVDGFVLAVPNDKKEAYTKLALDAAAVFKDHGALTVVETWGDDVPEGKVTSFSM